MLYRLTTPGKLLHGYRFHFRAGCHLLARPQLLLGRTLLDMNLSFDHGDSGALFFCIHEKYRSDYRHEDISRQHIEVSRMLFRCINDEPALPQVNAHTIVYALDGEFRSCARFDPRPIGQQDRGRRIARPQHLSGLDPLAAFHDLILISGNTRQGTVGRLHDETGVVATWNSEVVATWNSEKEN